jgi:hypothetical protein
MLTLTVKPKKLDTLRLIYCFFFGGTWAVNPAL